MAYTLRASSPIIVNDTNAEAFTDISLPNVSVGDGIIIGTAIGNTTSTISSITISGEANAIAIGSLLTAAGQRMQLYYLSSATVAGTKAIHITYSAFSFAYSSFAIAVDAAIDLDDADQTASGDSLNMTASVANTFGIAIAVDGSAEPSVQSGYTLIEMLNVGAFTRGQYNADLDASGAKTIEMLGIVFQGITAAIFKPAGGGGTVIPGRRIFVLP